MRRLFRLWRLSARDLKVLWTALRHPNRPAWLIPAVLVLGFFAVDPFNFAIPALGIVDDLVLLPLLLHGLAVLAGAWIEGRGARPGEDRVVSIQ